MNDSTMSRARALRAGPLNPTLLMAALACALLMLLPATASANFHGGEAHTGYIPLDGPQNVDTLVWSATAAGRPVVNGSSVAVGGGQVYDYSCGDDGNATVVCFDRSTGAHVWTSPVLDTGNSCSFDSWSSPVYDSTTGDVFIGTGSTLYRLSSVDGAIVWFQSLPAGIVNSSPLVTSTHVIIHTYGGFSPASSYICAFANDASGTFAWQHQHGGAGANAPVHDGGVIYDLIYLSGQGSEMRAYDQITGNTIWTTADLPLANDWFGGVCLAGGYLYAPTYSFGGNAELVKVDATNGAYVWDASIPSSNSTPVVAQGRVITVGDFSSAKVTATTTAGGADWGPVNLGSGGGWQVSAFQAGSFVYVAPGNAFGTQPLSILDAATGAVLDQTTDSMSGTPVVDGPDVLVPGQDGRIYCFTEFVTSVANWEIY